MNQSFLFDVMEYMCEKHKTQRRKYTNDPYRIHLAEVAAIASTVRNDHMTQGISWGHDVREDQGVTWEELAARFGAELADGVTWLSDLEKGTREERHAKTLKRLFDAPAREQDIKVADVISNTSSVVIHSPNFAVTYLPEKLSTLDVLTKATPRLRDYAYRVVKEATEHLERVISEQEEALQRALKP